MEKREALEILQELTSVHTIVPGEDIPQLKYNRETYQEAVGIFAATIAEMEKQYAYADSLKKEIRDYKKKAEESEYKADAMQKILESVTNKATEASKEKTVYEEIFNRIFKSGDPFSIQVGGEK